ncbi:NAD(P)-binding protein [Dentipellis sp. KUC8613]|nr:NAD(P)-binding protein [Dentipellis sp. KUC8613]
MDISVIGRKLARFPPFVQNLVLSGLIAFAASPAGLILGYLLDLSNRLCTPHPLAAPEEVSKDDLDSVSYDAINMLDAIPRDATHKGYAVIGGSGFVGRFLVKLLLLRGETNVRILDLVPPPEDIAENPSVSFVKTDMTSLQSVKDGLSLPFPSTGAPPDVIFHTAAAIRFWERFSYTWPASYNVNVRGTDNILKAASELPGETILIYTSTADLSFPRPQFMQIGKDWEQPPRHKVVVSDDDAPLDGPHLSDGCYARSKRIAEKLVTKANGEGMKTAIVRPGQTILGPGDRFLTSSLTMPRVPLFDKRWSHTDICVWDAAAAHLCLEDALQHRPEDVRGETFLVTSAGPAWTMQACRDALQHYSSRTLPYEDVQPLLIFVLAHAVELFLLIRYYVLLPFFFLLGSRPRLTPTWMGELIYLQPTTLEYMRDVVIDDARARKLIGYRPQWRTAQTIKYTVDQIESEKVPALHGLQLKQE